MALEVAEATMAEVILAVALTPVQDHEAMRVVGINHLLPVDLVLPKRLAHRVTARHIATTNSKGLYSR